MSGWKGGKGLPGQPSGTQLYWFLLEEVTDEVEGATEDGRRVGRSLKRHLQPLQHIGENFTFCQFRAGLERQLFQVIQVYGQMVGDGDEVETIARS